MVFAAHQAASLVLNAGNRAITPRSLLGRPTTVLVTGALTAQEADIVATLLASECAQKHKPALTCHPKGQSSFLSFGGPQGPSLISPQPAREWSPGITDRRWLDSVGTEGTVLFPTEQPLSATTLPPDPYEWQTSQILEGVYQSVVPEAKLPEYFGRMRLRDYAWVIAAGRRACDTWTTAWWKRSHFVILFSRTSREALVGTHLQVKRMRSYPATVVMIFLAESHKEAHRSFRLLIGAMEEFLGIRPLLGGVIPLQRETYTVTQASFPRETRAEYSALQEAAAQLASVLIRESAEIH
ncbi:MAG: hypothetical protein NZ899_04010 [Thermoguttaceae bacterium]|nr:hypothetical protein [Thermoguttaceae bacterium]MDW8077701.1 hypothetical protein [Thermoguttaceae bacterium]